ncbi:MAG: LLM class flavin-dependent oxidoreductase, partial [Bacteroidota bacterium]
IRKAQESFPTLSTNHYGQLEGNADPLPKPVAHKIPMLMTGYSQQSLEWNAEHGDGWMSYPRNLLQQEFTIAQWRALVAKKQNFDKPFMQPLYVVLQEEDDFKPLPIQLGFRIGVNYLIEYLHAAKDIGVNHVAINLRFNGMDMSKTLDRLAERVLPHFHHKEED